MWTIFSDCYNTYHNMASLSCLLFSKIHSTVSCLYYATFLTLQQHWCFWNWGGNIWISNPNYTASTTRGRMSYYGFTCSLMNCSTWEISPVKPEASPTTTLLWHWENENTSPATPRVKSFEMSAADIALLDARNFSLKNNGSHTHISQHSKYVKVT